LRFVGASVLPWRLVARLDAVPSGLYEALWASRLDQLDLVSTDAIVIDCGTAADYLQANLLACHGCSSIGAGAVVEGRLIRSVVWDGAYVGLQESLVDAVRAGTRAHPVTVTVHPPRLPLAPPSQHRDHERR
jgi:MurNAc alpha-1-phosphate uridylyltransferase